MVARVERYESVAPVAREWNELTDRIDANPFTRPGWFDAWWRAFGTGGAARLEILTVRNGGRLSAVVPLIARRGVHEPPTNAHTVELACLAEDDGAASVLASAMLARRPRRMTLRWANPERCGVGAITASFMHNGYRTVVDPSQQSPFIPLQGGWARYESQLSNKVRSDLRRRRRRLAERGEVSVEVSDGSERLDELLAEGFRVEAAGWKGRAGTAIASRAETHRFYVDVAGWAATMGILRLAFLRVGERPVAFMYAFEDERAFYNIKTGYEPAFSEFAPARLLLSEMVQRAFVRGLERFEFLGRDEPYKLEWTSTCHEAVRVHAFAPTLPGRLEWAAFTYGWPVAKRASATARTARGALERARSRRSIPASS
jgi:CelD/BcsL family acetyltransferase involved in cellulose biosynthesis